MKTFKILISTFFVFFLLVGAQSFTTLSDVEGTWMYEVENAPYGYEKGEIIITNEDEGYKAVIVVAGGKINGEKVTVNGGQVSFDIYIEGVKVIITLDIEGDSFKGAAKSSEGTFNLNGKRK